jgi:hypothetical protein
MHHGIEGLASLQQQSKDKLDIYIYIKNNKISQISYFKIVAISVLFEQDLKNVQGMLFSVA